ncbi:carnitine dehydratase [Bradyrhizobium sp. UNPF46]|uniref:CaiB/BaiF CoA transferase family protein n=1 Tax=Bradyrhizobium sp. UNPF46 TaxID=1141168 RepID=UPI00114F806D|nr:CaiB/BaiF CoA-transferase family protein [Bradyrhizobium sp. UNPF46]TQF27578.1 carnitine dehydratase [Bradyrhizobium sp. UNPF46]
MSARVEAGPLAGVKVIELAGIGPAPFCGMLLSDLGADIIRIDRQLRSDLGLTIASEFDFTSRGRRSITADLKSKSSIEAILKLVERADVLIEGFRPGVIERLGLGPDVLLARNPRLVIGRVTGWGQEGPLAQAAGHDINYIAITGALACIGREGERPVVPLNLVGDYGGGAVYLAFGVVSALLHASKSRKGQVVDAAMVDGATSLMALFYGRHAAGLWKSGRASNELDGGAPWYDTYQTKDKRYIAIGAIEPKFFQELLKCLGIDAADWMRPDDPVCWPDLRRCLEATFAKRTRDEWDALLQGSDACYAPILDLAEAPMHPHSQARQAFVEVDGITQPNVAPRFSITPGEIKRSAPQPGQGGLEALRCWDLTESEIDEMRRGGIGWSS